MTSSRPASRRVKWKMRRRRADRIYGGNENPLWRGTILLNSLPGGSMNQYYESLVEGNDSPTGGSMNQSGNVKFVFGEENLITFNGPQSEPQSERRRNKNDRDGVATEKVIRVTIENE